MLITKFRLGSIRNVHFNGADSSPNMYGLQQPCGHSQLRSYYSIDKGQLVLDNGQVVINNGQVVTKNQYYPFSMLSAEPPSRDNSFKTQSFGSNEYSLVVLCSVYRVAWKLKKWHGVSDRSK